jgi:protocatechuate 3,4-dioxygenase beta subunit
MVYKFFPSLLCLSLFACGQSSSQQQIERSQQTVGGRCEGCEAIYESKIPFEALNEVDTLSTFNEQGPKLVISGTVYKSDGKTPAPDVVLYVYHTDQSGKYRVIGNETGWGRRHGSIRGWMKTNAKGEYRFYTIRPASYSQTGPPAHIHVTVKEPDKNEYWIDDFHFEDDPFFTPEMRRTQQNRGGNGILKLIKKNGLFYGQRNIYLGKNVTDYPEEKTTGRQLSFVIGLLF